MKKMSESMVKQMIVLIAGLLVFPLLAAGLYLYYQITNDLTQMEQENVHNMNETARNLIQNLGENLLDVNKSNTYWEDYRTAVARKDVKWVNANINVEVGSVPNLQFVSTYDLNGNLISQAGNVQEFSGKLKYNEMLTILKRQSAFIGLVQTSKGLAMVAVSRITNETGTAKPTGFLIFGEILNNNSLLNIKNTLHAANIALLTNSGTMLSTSNSINNKTLSGYLNTIQTTPNQEIFNTNRTGSNVYAETTATLRDFSNKPIGILDVSQVQKTSTQIKARLLEVNLIIGVILFLIIIGISVMAYRRMIIPIHQLVSISNDVSKGKLTNEVDEKILTRKDELGELGTSINKMIHNFRELISELFAATDQVASSAEELSASIEETSAATQKISQSIQEVAAGTETQLQGATKSVESVRKMAEDVQEITKSVSIVSIDSSQTAKEAEEGNRTIQTTVKQMKTINESVNQSVTTVTKLNERSHEIEQIVSMITSIASQTNLLALNAAIEAARAGEQGKGFAVVASEVRVLAEQTSNSAQKVSELIGEIQNDSLSSSQSMDRVLKDVQLGVKQVHETGQVFERILLATQHLAEQVQKVSAVSGKILGRIQEVSGTAESMAAASKSSSEHSLEVAAASQEQAASMTEITSFVESLNQLAQELQQLFNKFKM